jgi:hypothetical protein
VARKYSDLDFQAPIHWLAREEFFTYFDSLPAEERWSNPQHRDQQMIWHWEERRWWALKEESRR